MGKKVHYRESYKKRYTACGIDLKYGIGRLKSRHWNEVTYKNCLKQLAQFPGS
jgi:hypothetical protein